MTEPNQPAAPRGVPLWAQILIFASLAALLVIVGKGVLIAQEGTVQPNETIPDFTMPLFADYGYRDRNEIKLSDLRGRVVVINFWASWCKPCEQEAAALQSVWEQYEDTDQVVFIGADYVDTPNEASIYLKKFGITYPNGPADAHPRFKLSQIFRIKGVPETYIVDPEGVLRYVKVGPFLSEDELAVLIEQLLP